MPEQQTEHVITVAFHLYGMTRHEAHLRLVDELEEAQLLADETGIGEWWVAEDDRTDGSDNDSAVFVDMGKQEVASVVLFREGMTGPWNVINRPGQHHIHTNIQETS